MYISMSLCAYKVAKQIVRTRIAKKKTIYLCKCTYILPIRKSFRQGKSPQLRNHFTPAVMYTFAWVKMTAVIYFWNWDVQIIYETTARTHKKTYTEQCMYICTMHKMSQAWYESQGNIRLKALFFPLRQPFGWALRVWLYCFEPLKVCVCSVAVLPISEAVQLKPTEFSCMWLTLTSLNPTK